ncbi:MAG TPA: SLBB domain-containing protein [Mucilaginibacter sp.]|jgi:protein involved in polysaccharide export with SLBB domain|nr:SLBB domain-containing protein [Mucilaginibacter sp.]
MNYSKIYLFVSVIFLSIFGCLPQQTTAQSLQNISSVNIDELSDAQVKKLIQQAQSSGLSDDQLIQMARNKGMSNDQVQRLQARVAAIRQGGGADTNDITDTANRSARQLNGRDTMQVRNQNSNNLNDLQVKIFGSDIFRNSPSGTFSPNMKIATPVNYIVGPDDQLHINVYGNSVANWNPTVSPEGNINIPGVGVINVAGRTIEQTSAIIKSKLVASNYAIGRGTEVKITLGDIRTIRVMVQGQVIKPAAYNLSSLATVMTALYAAGGPNDNGSFRQISVIRNSRRIRTFDVYDYLVNGSRKDDIALQDQDIILVPTYHEHVEINGEVKIPAIFEPLAGETLQDVLNFAGGFTDRAYTARIKVTQVSDQQQRITDVVETNYKNYIPLSGDKYVVEKILNRFENRVTIKGAVFRPGEYELQKGLTVSQLIKNAAGLKEDAFTNRASIVRLNADNTTQQISFNVNDVNNPANDIQLQREDIVTISSIFDLRNQYKVTVSGEVRNPGEFAYADSMKVADLIMRAGGFTEGASTKRIEVSRRVFDSDPTKKDSRVAQVYSVNIDANLKEGEANFVLKPFDMISIYSLPGYETQKQVKVEGEVIYPGYYTIQKKNERISDIIVRAGGLTASADVEGASLKRDREAAVNNNKTKIDTAAINKEHIERLKKLQKSLKDSTSTIDVTQLRNNFVGIDLRNILKNPDKEEDLILENGDVLRIPKQLQTVSVNGEVLFPSSVVYNGHKSLHDYVLNAGGYSPSALRRGAYVVYPNGTVKGTRKFLFFNSNPRVKPGSEIYIPKKPITKDSLPEILALTSSLVSMAAIVFGILSLHK